MLTKSKKLKLVSALKTYSKTFLNKKMTELDESGTRLMINSFLSDVLGYQPIEEIKTEYMIRGTYADYVIQCKGIQHFLVEVKAFSLELSENHLRQAVNYGANEGIEWVLLTNGKNFDFYRVIFGKPIQARKIFSLNLTDKLKFKEQIELIEFLHKESVIHKGLDLLWNKALALDPDHIAGFFFHKSINNFIKRHLNKKFKTRFTEEEVNEAISKVITTCISLDKVKPVKVKKLRKPTTKGTPES